MFLKYYFPIITKILMDFSSDPLKLRKPIYIIKKIKRLIDLKHVSKIFPEKLIEKIEKNERGFRLIDIRNEKDFYGDLGHIKGSISIPLLDLIDDLDKLKEYENNELIIICEVGRSSKFIAHLLAHQGYKNLKNLIGGINNWIEKGYPIIRDENRKMLQKVTT